MLRTIWGDDERYRAQYWADIPGAYFTGDGAYSDHGRLLPSRGRVDDVLTSPAIASARQK
jgi:acetyl-CoA synthetase